MEISTNLGYLDSYIGSYFLKNRIDFRKYEPDSNFRLNLTVFFKNQVLSRGFYCILIPVQSTYVNSPITDKLKLWNRYHYR